MDPFFYIVYCSSSVGYYAASLHAKIHQYTMVVSREKLEAFLLRSMEDGLVSDGVIAQDINQASSFWRIREVPIFYTIYLFLWMEIFINYWEHISSGFYLISNEYHIVIICLNLI